MPRVVILDPLAEEGLQLLERSSAIEYEVCLAPDGKGLKGDALKAVLANADGAICRSGVKITADILAGNHRLRAIARAGVGVDNIDFMAAKRQGIIVMNTPAGNTLSTAEHAIALMMALSRNIAPAYQSLVEGRWDRKLYEGVQLAGKTLGIVGLGRIGLAVAARAKGLEMRVIGFDPFLPAERAASLGIEVFATVDEMLPHCDFLTVHTPLNEQTKGLINEGNLDRLKPGVRLINCARGGIYEEAALVKGLDSGKIAGVALDVYADEPCTTSPLFGKPGVVCTPHLGASTAEAQTNVAVEAAELLIDFFETGAIKHAVNMPAVDPKDLETLRPYLNLCWRLGLLQAELAGGSPVRKVELMYRGKIAESPTKILTSAFCAGLLQPAFDYEINIVNSEDLLLERGIQLQASRQRETGDFSSLVVATVVNDRGEKHMLAGTVFGNQMLRLVRLDDERLEAYLDGVMFIFHHDDRPGVIGYMGSVLGKHEVNIAAMSVGRAHPKEGGRAIGVLHLDNVPSAEAIKEILENDKIHKAQVVKLPGVDGGPAWLSS